MLQDREEIFADRIDRFKEIIRQYQNRQVELINQKSRDQQQAERNKILKQSKDKDQNYFNKKEKTLQTDVKIMKSRKINECRMSKMKLRHQLIQRIQEDIKRSLTQKIKDQKVYKQLLKQLIIQGLIKMLEQNVQLKCLKRDVALIKEIVPVCEKEFNQMSSIKTKIIVNERQNLNDSDLGGIYVTSNNGRIVCNNTMAARLEYSMQKLLPQIREILFFNQKTASV